jgi:hypothetical protein
MAHGSSAASSKALLPPQIPGLSAPFAAATARWTASPSLREVILLALLTGLLFAATILPVQNYSSAVDAFGDSPSYVSVASAIHHWDFRGLQIKQFWGYPYAIAFLSVLTHIPEQYSLLVVSCLSSFVSIMLAYKLWGGWVAAFFVVLNFDWMQRSFLGGSEPLAVALIFGAFLAFRRDRYLLAAFLASLSTVVRPLGIFCLVGIGAVLLYRREFKKFALAVLIGTAIGGLYVLPLTTHLGDPLATVHSYQGEKFSLFGLPFLAIVRGTILLPSPWTSLALSFGWILLVLAGVAMMFRDSAFGEYARKNPAEVLFAALYLLMVFCYNYPVFARSNFARFAIPALPIVFLALSRWMPNDRRVLWVLGCVTPVLAAASALGIRNVIRVLHGSL